MCRVFENEVIFISGKITNDPNYYSKFLKAQAKLEEMGFIVLNPIYIPARLKYEQQMAICFSYIDQSKYMYMLKDHKESEGSQRELHYGHSKKKKFIFED